jgi:hypothetical protein
MKAIKEVIPPISRTSFNQWGIVPPKENRAFSLCSTTFPKKINLR